MDNFVFEIRIPGLSRIKPTYGYFYYKWNRTTELVSSVNYFRSTIKKNYLSSKIEELFWKDQLRSRNLFDQHTQVNKYPILPNCTNFILSNGRWFLSKEKGWRRKDSYYLMCRHLETTKVGLWRDNFLVWPTRVHGYST